MLPTPDTSHVSFDNVYEPAEDSFLMLDALSAPSEVAFLNSVFGRQRAHCPLVLEIGTGSGVVLAFVNANANAIFGRSDVVTCGSDINMFACTATSKTVPKNSESRSSSGTFLDAINGDLASPFCRHSIDVLIFNPPYVPSETLPSFSTTTRSEKAPASKHDLFQRDSSLLALATDGGPEGMDVTNRVLDSLDGILNKRHGIAYILLCAQNRPAEVIKRLQADWKGWDFAIVRTSGKQGGWEKLVILRISRATQT